MTALMAATRALVRGGSLLTRKPVERLMAELGTREYPPGFHDHVGAFGAPEARSALRTINRLLRE